MLKTKLIAAGVLVAAGAGGLGAAHIASAQSQPAPLVRQSQAKAAPDSTEPTSPKVDTDNINQQQGPQDQQGADQAEPNSTKAEKDTGNVDNQQGSQQGPNDNSSGLEAPDTSNN